MKHHFAIRITYISLLTIATCTDTRGFYPDGCGNFEASRGLHNKLLGLENEDIDEYTKIVVDRT